MVPLNAIALPLTIPGNSRLDLRSLRCALAHTAQLLTFFSTTNLQTSLILSDKMSDLYPSDLAQPLVTDVLVSDSEQDVAEQELVVPQTPVKKGNKKAALNNGATPTKKTPAPKKASIKKSSAKAKNQGENDEDGATPLAPTSSAKKRSADANNDTPSKKRATGGGARANGIPSSKSKLSEEDKLIIDMKDNGRGWKEIEAEWAKITGKAPGIDYCRKRYPKLKAATVEWADGDVSLQPSL